MCWFVDFVHDHIHNLYEQIVVSVWTCHVECYVKGERTEWKGEMKANIFDGMESEKKTMKFDVMRIFGKWHRKWLVFEKGWIDTIKQIGTLSSKYEIFTLHEWVITDWPTERDCNNKEDLLHLSMMYDVSQRQWNSIKYNANKKVELISKCCQF